MRTEAPSFASRRASAMASLPELKRRRASKPSVGLKATIQPPFSCKLHFADTRKVLAIDIFLCRLRPARFARNTGWLRSVEPGFESGCAGRRRPAGQEQGHHELDRGLGQSQALIVRENIAAQHPDQHGDDRYPYAKSSRDIPGVD